MTPKQLELCRLVGLVEECSSGVFVLTRAGRTLLGEKPPAAKVETNAEWLARVQAAQAQGGQP